MSRRNDDITFAWWFGFFCGVIFVSLILAWFNS